MSEDLLNPYWDRLAADQIAEGMNVARANASRLAADARIMLDAGRHETAAALAILSIEESGKDALLRDLALAQNAKEAKECWNRLRSHTAQNAMWIFSELLARGARRLAEFSAVFDPSADHTQFLERLKHICIYSDCYGSGRWHRPTGVMTEDLARHIVGTAETFATGRDVTTREIELWVQHMRPVWGRGASGQQKALAAWYAQMQTEGLVPAGKEGMARFIWGLDEPAR